jgi:hypothetical protein
MRHSASSKLSILGIVTVGLISTAAAQNQDTRKDATDATKQANSALLRQLPFSDNWAPRKIAASPDLCESDA